MLTSGRSQNLGRVAVLFNVNVYWFPWRSFVGIEEEPEAAITEDDGHVRGSYRTSPRDPQDVGRDGGWMKRDVIGAAAPGIMRAGEQVFDVVALVR